MQVKAFWMDKFPVTNAQFKKFMDATHYHPYGRFEFPSRLAERKLSGGRGQQACDVGVP